MMAKVFNMFGKQQILAAGAFSLALSASSALAASVVEFHIKAGTHAGGWNTQETMVVVTVGDTVRIINDDNVNHRLHTNGRPCAHGPEMAPGEHYDCVADEEYDAATDGMLYDHDVGSPSAPFYLSVGAAN